MGSRNLVGRMVEVQFTKEKFCSIETVMGLLWNVDPETGSCVVIVKQEEGKCGKYKLVVCTSHGMKSIESKEVSEDELKIHQGFSDRLNLLLQRKTAASLPLSAVEEKLSAARLPFEVRSDGLISILDDAAIIKPPYSRDTVESANDQILASVINLLT
eukprot:TRINITY_DN27578_c0_g1_i1.p1 TRINITY_DN27578_c0_g1~~TRINITY_DN27578_c0_g1_i1.p1  ORF type:complete len:158 (+),score=25.52 TRINITY_DN27578_c0_g1_i1:55-528(+)